MSEEIDPTTEPEGVDRRLFLGMIAGGVGGAAMVAIPAMAAWPSSNHTVGGGVAAPAPESPTATTAMGGICLLYTSPSPRDS